MTSKVYEYINLNVINCYWKENLQTNYITNSKTLIAYVVYCLCSKHFQIKYFTIDDY